MSHPDSKPLQAINAGPLRGKLTVPGDKSISHRALILGALSIGKTKIKGLLEAQDVLNTAQALTALGAPVTRTGDGWQVLGRGTSGLRQPDAPIDFGNSGTGTRLMMGVIAGHPMTVDLIGDDSLSRRPMGRVLDPLRQMGLNAEAMSSQNLDQYTNAPEKTPIETLPIRLKGLSDPIPITYELPVPSAQVKSAVLLAGLHAPGITTVIENEPSRDHTERMMTYFGARLNVTRTDGKTHIALQGRPELTGRDVVVPADPSSAAFLVAAAVIVPDSKITITNVLLNESRIGFYKTLSEMGASITFQNEREEAGEPIADIVAQAGPLKGINVPAERAPSMIDEYPVLSIVAAFARGTTKMEGLAELKVKESDRLAATKDGLEANGVKAQVKGDTMIVHGLDGKVPGGGQVNTHLDHRIAMAFLTMGLASQKPVTVDDVNMIATSFPQFQSLMESLGGQFESPKVASPPAGKSSAKPNHSKDQP